VCEVCEWRERGGGVRGPFSKLVARTCALDVFWGIFSVSKSYRKEYVISRALLTRYHYIYHYVLSVRIGNECGFIIY
jgi:hypothetical protein